MFTRPMYSDYTTQSAKKPAIIAKRAANPLLAVKELAADEVVAVEEELVSVEVEGAEEVAPELVDAPLDAFPPLGVPLLAPVVVTAPEEVAVPVPVVVALAVPEADEKGTELDVDAVIVTEMPMNERVSSRPWKRWKKIKYQRMPNFVNLQQLADP